MLNKIKTLIVGGGIAGLSLANFFEKEKMDYDLIEKCSKWKTIGYVLMIWPNGLNVLREIGLKSKVENKSEHIGSFLIYDPQGNLLYETNFKKENTPIYELERDGLHKVLRKLPKSKTRFNTTIKNIERKGDKHFVTFLDGTTQKYDLIVGADGINSQIRGYVDNQSKKDFSGHNLLLFWLNKDIGPRNKIISFIGRGKYIGIYPTKKLDHRTVYCSLPDKEKINRKEDVRSFILNHYRDMGGLVPEILKNLPRKPNLIFKNNDYEIHEKKWQKDGIVLIGDAAHATSPIMSMGASMAMEDSLVLTRELKNKPLAEALESYEQLRKNRVKNLALRSQELHILIGAPPILDKITELLESKIILPNHFEWLERFSKEPI